jgi:AcrR family transcriptional regulator
VGQTRPGGRSARVRAAILNAALNELLNHGYAELRIASIASTAGVHKTTVYRRWPTRERLVVDALKAQAATAIRVPDTGELREDLFRLARAVTRQIQSPVGGGLVRILLAESGRHKEIADIAGQFWRTRFDGAGQIVHRAIQRGELPGRTNPDQVVEALVGPLFMRTFLLFAPINDAYLARHVGLLLSALQTQHRRTQHQLPDRR